MDMNDFGDRAGSVPNGAASADIAICAPVASPAPWRRVCDLDAIPRLGARVVTSVHGNIAVFRTAADEVFALLDKCPHKGGPLSQGIVFGRKVACPLHGWNINLGEGTAVAPDAGCTRRFAAKIENHAVFLLI